MNILILGHGYLARHLQPQLHALKCVVQSTSRQNQFGRIEFDLVRDETWLNLPDVDCTVWTFPAHDLDLVKLFYSQNRRRMGRLIVVGSTSCFVHEDGETVDETFPWDVSRPRVRAEQHLLQQGAIVLLSSGIYGSGRSPLNWLRKGLIQDPNSVVNLIHVEDLARSCVAALQFGRPGESYIVSDDRPMRWFEIVDESTSCGVMQDFQWPTRSFVQKKNKFLSNCKIKSEFHIEWGHPRFEPAASSS